MAKAKKQKELNRQRLNRQINKAIATTVVVTTIGITSTINSFPIKATGPSTGAGTEEMEYVLNQEQNISETYLILIEDVVTDLLKQGNYKEAREIKKSFGLKNELAVQLRKFNYYAVHTV